MVFAIAVIKTVANFTNRFNLILSKKQGDRKIKTFLFLSFLNKKISFWAIKICTTEVIQENPSPVFCKMQIYRGG